MSGRAGEPLPVLAGKGAGTPRPPRALVVFSGESDLFWLRLLKPGFRHCFAILREEAGAGWLLVDARAHVTDLARLPDWPEARLAAWFRARGFRVLACAPLLPERRCQPPAPYTCVEAVKRLLGLRAAFVLTPYQLFRRLGGEAAI